MKRFDEGKLRKAARLLGRRGGASVEEIAEGCGATARTVRRWLAELARRGTPAFRYVGAGARYRLG